MKGPVETVGGKGSHLRFKGKMRSQRQEHIMSKSASLVYKDLHNIFIAKPELSRDAGGMARRAKKARA